MSGHGPSAPRSIGGCDIAPLSREHFPFLDTLRATAALLVVWDHLFALWPQHHGITMAPVALMRTHVNTPLGLIQDFGWLGVVMFFLISGFVITHVAQRETALEFAVKRVVRIFPMLMLATLMAVSLDPALRRGLTAEALLSNVLLVNYWMLPQVVLVGVAWTLAIEVVFYALMLCLFAWRRRPIALAALLLAAVAAVIALARSFGPGFFLFASTVSYLPYLVAGQLIYFALYARTLSPGLFAALLLGVYAVLVAGLRTIHVDFLPIGNSYLSSFVLALAVFLAGLGLNGRIRPSRVVKYLADTSYSLYLFHGIVGFFVLAHLSNAIGYPLALAAALVGVMAVVAVLHRSVERPVLEWGRRMARRLRDRGAPVSSR